MLNQVQDIEGQENINSVLERCITDTPLSLLLLDNQKDIDYVNDRLPYSIGIEIECHKSPIYKIEDFRIIPSLKAIDIDSGEQRYRIPNGINGFVCLYFICLQLRVSSLLNPGSGIHYHVDCTDIPSVQSNVILDDNSNWILPELDKWEFKGSQRRGIGSQSSWIRCNSLGTLEFRIGNMTFDYKEMVTCILSASSIVKRMKDEFNPPMPFYEAFEKAKFIDYLNYLKDKNPKYKIPKVNNPNSKSKDGGPNPNNIIKSRIIKL